MSETSTTAINPTVATTTWNQISRMTKMIWNARNPLALDNRTLRFAVSISGRPNTQLHTVQVTDSNDTYTIVLLETNTRTLETKEIARSADVYDVNLSKVIHDMLLDVPVEFISLTDEDGERALIDELLEDE